MSHQTGISASDDLKKIFADCLNGNDTRTLKVVIENECLVCDQVVKQQSESFDDDFDATMAGLIDEDRPCYVFMKFLSAKEWVFITYSPDTAGVREKMLYAATRASLKSEFGGTYVMMEYFATHMNEMTHKRYLEFVESKNAPPPLTLAEEELKDLDESETKTLHGASTKQQTSKSIEFPLTQEAQEAVQNYKNGSVTHVELSIIIKEEKIYNFATNSIGATELSSVLSSERAGYHLFNYTHRYENQDVQSHVFIYFMPGYSVPIKERMLYSTCKSSLLSSLEQDFGLKFDRKLECDNAAELTEEFLRNEIHPQTAETRKKFSKPTAPGRKPPSRRHR